MNVNPKKTMIIKNIIFLTIFIFLFQNKLQAIY
jgi:hypothetical protein